MLNFMGIIKKKFLDIARSSNAILKIIWKVDKVHKAFDYYWDLTTINIKKIIDSKEFCKNKNYLDMGCGQIAILGMYAKYMCPNMNVTSVDYYLEFVTNAKKVISLNNINIEALSINQLVDKVGKLQLIEFDLLGITFNLPFGLDANIFGILASLIVFILLNKIFVARQ